MANAADHFSSSPTPPTRICVFASTLLGNSSANADAARALANVFHTRDIHLVYGGGTSGLMGELARERVRLGGPNSVTGIIPGALVLPERGAKKGDTELTPVPEPVRRKKDGEGWPGRTLKSLSGKSKENTTPDTEAPADNSYGALLSSSTFGTVKVMPSLAARKAYMMELVATGGPGSGFIALPGGFGTFDEVGEVLAAKQMGVHNCKMVLFNIEGFWDGILQWVETGILKGIVRDEAKEMLVSRDRADECVQALIHQESVKSVLNENRPVIDREGDESRPLELMDDNI